MPEPTTWEIYRKIQRLTPEQRTIVLKVIEELLKRNKKGKYGTS